MAEILEAWGTNGKIVFIDGSPMMSRYLGGDLFDGDSYETTENNGILYMSSRHIGPL